MPRAGRAPFALQAHQVDPADLRTDRAAKPAAHPLGDQTPRPVVALWRRLADGRCQLYQVLGREQRRGAMGMGVVPIAHALSALAVVALGDLPDPVARVAGALGDVLGQLAPCQQPEDLPPAAFVRLLGRAVASLQLVDAHVRSEMNMSCHVPIRQEPSKRWYHLRSSGLGTRRTTQDGRTGARSGVHSGGAL